MAELPTTCVIGAGISGLTTGKALSDRGLPYTCFEASDDIGGNWYFGNPNGRSSAYQLAPHRHLPRQRLASATCRWARTTPTTPTTRRSVVPGPLRGGLRPAGPDPLRDAGRSTPSASPRVAGESRSKDGEVEEFDFLVVGNGPPLGPALPGLPGQLRRARRSTPTTTWAPPSRSTCTASACWWSGSATAPWTSSRSSPARGVAEKVFISTRSGAWVMPKYLFGRPVGEIVKTSPYLPLGCSAGSRGLSLHRLGPDGGLRPPPPQPQLPGGPPHRLQRAAAAPRLGRRRGEAQRLRAARRPRRLRGRQRGGGRRDRLRDGLQDHASPSSTRTSSRRRRTSLPLYKRIFLPGIDDLALIGFAQTIPTLFPFVELQSKLVARYVGGDYALPSEAEMEATIRAATRSSTSALRGPAPPHDAGRLVHLRARHPHPRDARRAWSERARGMAPQLAGRAERTGAGAAA